MNFVHLFQQAVHEVKKDLHKLTNPDNRPVQPPQISMQNETKNGSVARFIAQDAPGGPIRPPLAVSKQDRVVPQGFNVDNPLALDPKSLPKATAIFAPADKMTQQAVDQAAKIYGFTPEFMASLRQSQPAIAQADSLDAGTALKGGRAAGVYHPGLVTDNQNNNSIILSRGYGSSPTVVTHEGLHSVWQNRPEKTRQDFAKVYDSSATPDIKDYLASRLGTYSEFQGRDSLDQKFNKLNPSIQTEIHSFLSEYPISVKVGADGRSTLPQKLPPKLQKYYARFMNANDSIRKNSERYKALEDIRNAVIHPQNYLENEQQRANGGDY